MDITYTDAISSIVREARVGALQALTTEGGKAGQLLAGQAQMANPGGDTAGNDSYDNAGDLYAGFVVGSSLCGDIV